MLQLIRDRATGWIAWFIIILICIPFALWGIQEYVSPQGSLTVAEVNDSEIGYYQFQNAYQNQRRQLEQMLGQRISDPVMERRVRDNTLDRLVNEELLVQTVLGSGMRVGDAQLAEAIRALPVFGDPQIFTQDSYDAFLRARGLSASGFEQDLRRSLLGEQLLSAVQRSELVTRGEMERLWRLRNKSRHYRRLFVDPQSVSIDEPDDGAIASYFELHKDDYVQLEQVKISYIELSRDSIAAGIPVEEQELRAIYESSKGNYKTAEQREARHILVQLAGDATDSAVAEAKEKIDAIRARIQAGEDFAAVAKDASDDPGSASSGGSLGYFGRGVMDPVFEEAAFSQQQGVLGEPIRSSFGWHLIEVIGIQAEVIRDFDDVRAEVEAEYRNSEAQQLFAERVEELANLSFEHPESLEVAAEALSVTPQSSEFFARSGDGAAGIALNSRVRRAAFSQEVISEGNNSELLELAPGRVAVVRLLERKESRPLSLEEAEDQVREAISAQAQSAKATEVGETILAALKGGGDLDEVAAAHGQSFQERASASPAQSGALESAAQRALFSMAAPASEAEPAVVGLEVGGGGYEILALLQVEEAAAAPNEDDSKQLRAELESALGAASFQAMMRSIRERATVRVFEETLSADSL